MTDEKLLIEGKTTYLDPFTVYGVLNITNGHYEQYMILRPSELKNTMLVMCNDLKSMYYGEESKYNIVSLSTLDNYGTNTDITSKSIYQMSSFIDQKIRRYQTIFSTMNYVPRGLRKMTEDEQEEVKERLNEAIKAYIEEFSDEILANVEKVDN